MASLEQEVEYLRRNNIPETEIGKFIQDFNQKQPISTVTGKPVPTVEQKGEEGKKVMAGAARYAPPIAANIATGGSMAIPSLVAQAVSAGGGEYLARKIERVESDPELDTITSDLKAAGVTGMLDLGINVGLKGLGSAFRAVGRKIFIPSEIPLEVKIAQETLGNIPPKRIPAKEAGPIRKFLEFTGATKGKRPFSLTAGQINAEEKRFITWLEGVARSGFSGQGRMAAFDTRNKEAMTGVIQNYIDSRAAQTTAPEFSLFINRMIGNLNERGEVFEPVVAMRKYLYKQFDTALEASGATVNGTALRNFIRKTSGATDDLPTKIYNQLRREGLVPPLEAPSTTGRTITKTRTTKSGMENVERAQDMTRTDLLTGDETRTADIVKGTRTQSGTGETITTRETETIKGLTEEEIAAEWANLPATDVDKIIRGINSHWKDGEDAINNTLMSMKGRIEDRFLAEIDKTPELKKLYKDANAFFKQEVDYLRNDTIKAIRKSVSKNPSKILNMLGGDQGTTNARTTYDNLMTLKKSLQFSGEVAEGAGGAGAKKAMQKEWDESVLMPIRYDMITKHRDKFGYLDPDGFLRELNANSSVPEFYNEIFGGEKQVELVHDLMTTLSVLKKKAGQENLFIQLIQASQLVGGTAGAATAIFADDPEIKTGAIVGGTAILLGPYMLSKMLTNPELMRSFVDGTKAGVRSGKFGMALRKIAQQEYASSVFRDENTLSQDKLDFYTSAP